ncbi:serine hydrolase [Thalassotalea fusca]
MKKKLTVTIVALLGMLSSAYSAEFCDSECNKKLEAYIDSKMKIHGVPGVSVSIIKNGELVFNKQSGVSSIEHQAYVTKDDAFRLYSATKMLVNVAIFQLLEQEKLSLEDPVKRFIDSAPDSWQNVKIKHLLSHSSGIPNFIFYENKEDISNKEVWKKIVSLPIEFEAGKKHSYNQTNYWILARIIEKLSNKSLQKYIVDNQFYGKEDGIVFSSCDTEAIPKRLTKYIYDKGRKVYKRSTYNGETRGLAGNGISISGAKLTRWLVDFQQNKLLAPETLSLMLSPFEYIDSSYRFLHGLASYGSEDGSAFGFSGGGVSAIRCWQQDALCISVLSNGYKHYPVINEFVEEISWLIDEKYIEPNKQRLYELSEKALLLPDYSIDYSLEYSEGFLNSFGYTMLNAGKVELALSVFKLAVKRFPKSWNAYDSLAETFNKRGNHVKALNMYKKALALKPDDQRLLSIVSKLSTQQ